MRQLTDAQRAAVEHEGSPLLVSAAAGSGKTMVLVERLMRHLREGHDLTDYLIITYTEAAAAELRSKIAARLSEALAETPDDRHLRRQTHLLYLAQISTIHAFCNALLRQYAHLRDLPPDFRVMDEQQAELLRQQVMTRLLTQRYERADADFTALADTLGAGRSDTALTDAALKLYDTLRTHAHPAQWVAQCREQLDLRNVTDAGQTIWGQEALAAVRRTAAAQVRRMTQAIELAQQDALLKQKYAPSLLETRDALVRLSQAEHWDDALVCEIPFPGFSAAAKADAALKNQIKALRDHCKSAVSALQNALYDCSDMVLSDLRSSVPATLALFDLAEAFGQRYTAEKRRRGLLDFSDLEHETIALLTDRYSGAPTATAKDISAGYHEVMVDEYQDCNQVQDTIFRAVSGNGEKLFMVGDVKQSIYRFRLADPKIFLEKYHSFSDTPGMPRRVILSQNFRSQPAILEAANHVFRTCMSEEVGELDYGDAEALYPGAQRPALPTPPVELHVIDCKDDERNRVECEAAFIAARIRRMLDHRECICDDGALRPVTPGDIVILLPSPRSVAAAYLSALAAAGIPATGSGGNLLETTEAYVLLSTLRIIDNPHQDIPLAAAMSSPVFGFTAEELAQIRQAADGDLFTALTAHADADTRCDDFLRLLERWRVLAQTQPLPELIWTVLQQSEMEPIFGTLSGGAQRRRNLLSIYEASMDFHGGLSVFLDAMELRRIGDGMEPVPVSDGAGMVRLMSIHKSKGLEFPVVFVSDLSRQFNLQDLYLPVLSHPTLGVGIRAVDLDQMQQFSTFARTAISQRLLTETLSEQLRVLYVAMTRAVDRMILTCCESNIGRHLANVAGHGFPADPYAVSLATNRSHWVLMAALLRPEAQILRHAAQADDAGVIPVDGLWEIQWHDTVADAAPAAVEPSVLSESTPSVTAPLAAFSYAHVGTAATPSKLTATQLKGRYQDEEAAESAVQWVAEAAAPRFERPQFVTAQTGLTPTERGIAAHLFMQYADYARCTDAEGIRAELTRLTAAEFLSQDQADAVRPETILAFVCHPLGQAVRSAPQLLREFKFSLLDDAARYYPSADSGEQILLQGVIDCAIIDADGLTILDFKTDRIRSGEEAARAARYRGQLDAYARALERIYKLPVRRKVLWFFSTGAAAEL